MSFRILVVDDNRALVEALVDIFEAKGYEADTAFDGVQALEKVRESAYDCILMDIRMPRMNGVSAFKEIKTISPGTPVVLMTAYSVQGLIDEARAEGVLAVIQKPVAIEKILGIIRELNGASSVLIVDSPVDPVLLNMVTSRGYRTNEAGNVSDAVMAVLGGSYDAVFLSREIPGLTSDSLVLIRECDPKCLIILTSSEPGTVFDPSVCATLQKPFKMKDVVALLDRVRTLKVQQKLGPGLFEF